MANKCPNCGNDLTVDFEEYAGDTYDICWWCPDCGTRVIDHYRYSDSEAYTQKEWYGEAEASE